MSAHAEPDGLVVLSELSGMTVVRLMPGAVDAAAWPGVRAQVKRLLHESPAGIAVDCRALSAGATAVVAPLLYELLVAGRRRVPRIEVCAVGKPEQTTGISSAFLLPPRFPTVEAAAAALQTRRTSGVPVKFAHGQGSEKPLIFRPTRPSFGQTFLGQIALTLLVFGFTIGIVAYSAAKSFSQPVVPRRIDTIERGGRIVLQGKVKYATGRALSADSSAIVLAWPAGRPAAKFKLTGAHVFGSSSLPVLPALVIAATDAEGQYAIKQVQLPESAAPYHFLVISNHAHRKEAAPAADLDKLAAFFVDPHELLDDRQFVLQSFFLDANVTKDQDFIVGDVPLVGTAKSALQPGVEQPLPAPESPPPSSSQVITSSKASTVDD